MAVRTELSLHMIKRAEKAQRFATDPDRVDELAASIKQIGLMNPITVRQKGDDYEIVAGDTRYQACERAGLAIVPVTIVEGNEEDVGAMTFAENFFRTNLTPIEQAVAIGQAYESGAMTIEQIGKAFGHSKDWVARQISITHWPEDCIEAIHLGKISVAASSNLAQIDNDRYRQFLLSRAVADGASARATAAWLQAWRANQRPEQAVEAEPVPAGQPSVPMSPQSPCLACSAVFPMDALSYVPFCVDCIQAVRQAAKQ